ncbi:alpha/beta fold hydrolase [Geodermatophilus sabuli]|uniref:Pimeloyl-ACP methyl ester carboxylesterase n=1 Tax=Geodermatophilus sabuli TaxID=1564158 RepID=A0A285E851_9ACTN|nr:alpha/beta fold hydrolase [Geodermatophilus sabuli]MBB3081865.1 pimeloyl-ACP methyl ester carboxylesterase [Geodermatophilus sabuli]SNX95262.1 Pimeloyl-ACP methyl ester carboxylesterase [Geodermatophilus sabuli]
MATSYRASGFTGPHARARFLTAYDRTLDRLWPVPVRAEDLTTSLGTVRVYRAGPAGDDPVVLLAGAGGNALSWYRHVGPLAGRRPVLVVDPLGEPGRSEGTGPIPDGDAVGRWLLEVLAACGARRAHLVGSSFGGWTALVAQRQDAERRIAALTLVDPAGLAPLDRRFLRWVLLGGLAALLPAALRRRAARRLVNGTLLESELLALGVAGRGFRRRLPTPPVLTDAELAAVEVPTSVLLGARSALHDSAAVAERIARAAPHWRVEVVPDAGHALQLEAAGLVVARVLGEPAAEAEAG